MKNWRINLFFLCIFLTGSMIITRLFFLQVLDRDFYKAFARGQQSVFKEMPALRGEIFFRDEINKLAGNYSYKSLHLDPAKVTEKDKIAQILSQILSLSKDAVMQKLRKDSFDEVIKTELSEKEISAVQGLGIDGAYVSDETRRVYPQNDLASHAVGYVGGERRGQYGVEEFYENELKGVSGTLEGEKDPKGHLLFFGLEKYQEPQNGSDLILTLDYNIQFFAEKLLNKAKDDLHIQSGSILVLDPASGEIIASANIPEFNPNKYSSYDNLEVFLNPASQKLFEPGSVMKPITMASAINEGKINPTTTYEDPGQIKINGFTIYNYGQRQYPGQTTMTEVLEKSINTGAVFAEKQVGGDLFLKYLKNFGFFQKTGVDLPGEAYSDNNALKEGRDINLMTASFGQGIIVTQMQLASAFAAIANDGRQVQPHIVKKIIRWDGKEINIQPKAGKEIIDQKTSASLVAMLVSVTENGYGKKAKVPGYYVAGKTGTAQVPWTALGINKSGYSDETIQSFIGFAPAFSPRFVILIKLDNPATKTSEYSTVPIFQEMAKYITDYWQIPPDYQK